MLLRSPRLFSLAISVAFLLGVQVANAQLAPGDRVRIKHGKERIAEGDYLGRDSLGYATVLADGDTIRVPFDSAAYTAFVERHRRGWGALRRGAAIGGGAGLMVIGLYQLHPPDRSDDVTPILATFAVAALTVGGILIGGITAIGGHNFWEQVEFTPALVTAP